MSAGFIAGIVISTLAGVALGIRKFFCSRELRLGTIYTGDVFGSVSLLGLVKELVKSVFLLHVFLFFILALVFTSTGESGVDCECFLIYLLSVGVFLLLADLGSTKPWFFLMDWEGGTGSAWRSLFVANELYERASVVRVDRVFLWIFALIGLNWLDRADERTGWAVCVIVWLGTSIGVILVKRIVEIFRGSDILNFIDVLSLANISLAIIDNPGRVRYVHGKAPSGKGDWSSEELEKKLRDEATGLLVKRGLFPQDPSRKGQWQSFTLINQEAGFQDKLANAVRDLVMLNYAGRTASGRVLEVKKELSDLIITHVEIAGTSGNVRAPSFLEKLGLRIPGESNVLLEDPSGVAWTDALLRGGSFFGFPVGEELRMLIVELISFLLIIRYHGSLYIGAAVAYAVSFVYLSMRNAVYKTVIARTTGIDPRFLL